MTTVASEVAMREIFRRDMEEIVEMEHLSHRFFDPDFERDAVRGTVWGEEEVKAVLAEPHTRGYVMEQGPVIVGYWIYELEKDRYSIRRLLVHPDYRKSGFGSMMVDHLQSRSHRHHKRRRVSVVVSEQDFGVCEFFAKLGFKPRLLRSRDGSSSDNFEYLFVSEGSPVEEPIDE